MAKKQEKTTYPITAFIISKFTMFLYYLCYYGEEDEKKPSFWMKIRSFGFEWTTKSGLTWGFERFLILNNFAFIPKFNINVGSHYLSRVFSIGICWLCFNISYNQYKDNPNTNILNHMATFDFNTGRFISLDLGFDWDYNNYLNKTTTAEVATIDKHIYLSVGEGLTLGYGRTQVLTKKDLAK